MWAEVVDEAQGFYKLDNIPFYVPLIACNDVVFAEYDDAESFLTYRKTIEHSGNSTIHVIIMDDSYEINTLREIFDTLGCESERLNHKYFAMEVPAQLEYIPIKKKLNELRKDDILDYAESCLSENHQY